jgi:hypothetical protein
MSIQDYANLGNIGDITGHMLLGGYVHIYHDSFIHNVKNNVLGRYDDHNIGKIVGKLASCVEVQYGSEANIGTYDNASVGTLTVSLKPTAMNTTGSLGNPAENKKGVLMYWSNFGKGDTVKVSAVGLGKPPSLYSVNDLVFTIVDSIQSGVSLVRSGGSRRVTLRNKKFSSKYTRLVKRV